VRSLRLQLLACIAIGAVIRIAAYDVGPVQRADLRLLELGPLPPGTLHRLADAIVSPFDPAPYALLVAAVIGAALLAGRRELAIAAAALMIGAAATTQVLKPLLAADRPRTWQAYLPSNAWPSGHTTAAAALALALVLLTPPGRRRPVAIAAAVSVALVGVALEALGRHFASDVLGGLCVAGAWGAVAWRVASRQRARTASP
jgi:membrane-associated phospholipid phosphatase